MSVPILLHLHAAFLSERPRAEGSPGTFLWDAPAFILLPASFPASKITHKICSFGLKMFTASGIVTRRAAELPILFRVCSLLRFKPKIARVHGAKMEAPERMVLECNFSWSVLSEEAGSEREWACERPYAFCPPPECK